MIHLRQIISELVFDRHPVLSRQQKKVKCKGHLYLGRVAPYVIGWYQKVPCLERKGPYCVCLIQAWLYSHAGPKNALFHAESPNLPNGYLKVAAKVGHEMEETLGVGVEQIQAPDSAMVGVVLDQRLQEKMQICQLNSQRLLH